jgi:hypothetical protein
MHTITSGQDEFYFGLPQQEIGRGTERDGRREWVRLDADGLRLAGFQASFQSSDMTGMLC